MTDELSGKGRVPKEELRELVEEWRELQDDGEGTKYSKGVNRGLAVCADGLERSVERYE